MAEPFSFGGIVRAAVELVKAIPNVGSDVTRHNREVERIYEDTTSWAQDELRNEADAVRSVYVDPEGYPLYRAGQTVEAHRIRADFAERWRNRERQARRDIEDLRDSENVLHGLWRRLRRRSWPENPDQAEVERITAEWRKLAR
jgi:hypothetical protein